MEQMEQLTPLPDPPDGEIIPASDPSLMLNDEDIATYRAAIRGVDSQLDKLSGNYSQNEERINSLLDRRVDYVKVVNTFEKYFPQP